MRAFFLSFLLFLLPAAALAEDSGEVILVVGDSLSASYGLRPGEGWVNLLERRLEREGYPHQVINASVSGETTRGALARLPRALALHRPSLVIIELGGNDGLRGFPLDVMRANLGELIRLSREAGAEVMLLGMHLPPNYGEEYTRRFHKVFVDLADAEQVPFLPFILEDVATKPGMMQADGIHPTAEAQPLMLESLWPVLERLLEVAETAS